MPSKRDAKFVELRNNGFSNADIAKKYGISRERVRQILNKLNYAGKPDLRYKKCTPEQEEFNLRRKRAFIRHWQKQNPDRVTIYRKITQGIDVQEMKIFTCERLLPQGLDRLCVKNVA